VSLRPTSRLFLDEAAVIDWGGGLRWMVDPDGDLREKLENEDGHATLVKHQVKVGSSGVEIFQPLAQPLLGIHQRLKNRFDPIGIFNPGRMYQDF
jgi:glycolate oxidase FAD binding subunit